MVCPLIGPSSGSAAVAAIQRRYREEKCPLIGPSSGSAAKLPVASGISPAWCPLIGPSSGSAADCVHQAVFVSSCPLIGPSSGSAAEAAKAASAFLQPVSVNWAFIRFCGSGLWLHQLPQERCPLIGPSSGSAAGNFPSGILPSHSCPLIGPSSGSAASDGHSETNCWDVSVNWAFIRFCGH